jgi:hypothetical protein
MIHPMICVMVGEIHLLYKFIKLIGKINRGKKDYLSICDLILPAPLVMDRESGVGPAR